MTCKRGVSLSAGQEVETLAVQRITTQIWARAYLECHEKQDISGIQDDEEGSCLVNHQLQAGLGDQLDKRLLFGPRRLEAVRLLVTVRT